MTHLDLPEDDISDRQLTELQETGVTVVNGHTLARIVALCDVLGIDARHVVIRSGCLVVANASAERALSERLKA